MSKDSIVFLKSKNFSIRIVKLYKFLTKEKTEFILSKQLLRSGTSIGANLAEAIYGISRKDFISKTYIALKECSETKYWLELLFETEYISESQFKSMEEDCIELIKLLTSITKTARNNDEDEEYIFE